MNLYDEQEIIGVITVRSRSTRLPKKCFLEFGDGTVLDHVIRRVKFFGMKPIISTTNLPEDDIISSIAASHGCPCFRGSERDKLQRWADTCKQFDVEQFHTVDADDPFFDGDLAGKSMTLLRTGTFDAVYPSEETYLASVGYSLTASIIARACALKSTDDTEMMWYYLEKVPGFNKAVLQVPDARVRTARLTLDYQEDYWLLRSILRILGPYCTRPEIETLFLENPQLHLVNWFRNHEWRALQLEKQI